MTFSVPLQMLTNVQNISNTTQCGGEWKSYGVCCNTNTLAAHIADDARNVREASDRLVKIYINFRTVSKEILDSYSKLSLLTTGSQWSASLNTKIQAAKDFLNNMENVNSLDLTYTGDFAVDS